MDMHISPHIALPRKARRPAHNDASGSPDDSDPGFVVALARGLEVLDCFRGGETLLGSRELARRCKLSRATLARITHTLAVLGYLNYDEQACAYRLGTASITMAGANVTQQDVRRIAQPLMESLAEFSGADVALAIRDRMNMVCIQICRKRNALTLSLDVGRPIPLTRSAIGKAYLAAAPMAERSDLLVRLRDADEYTWPQTKAVIDDTSKEYLSSGFCVAEEEWQQGVNEIAVPFFPGSGLPGMVFAVCGPAPQLPLDYLRNEIAPRLLELSRGLPRPSALR